MRVLFAGGLMLAVTAARAVAPNFTTVTPAGGQRGTELEITLRGERLADAQEIFLYGAGITVKKIVEATERQVKVALEIAPDCRLGEHALRVRTAGGISPLRIFYVGPFPAREEKEPNNTAATAQKVALNTTVQGQIGSEDVDYFSVTAQEGQRLSVEVEGARLGRTMFDPYLAIEDASGKILATSDDTPLLGHDGFISLIVPAEGRYVIRLRDRVYAGNAHFYRLHVGTFPRPAVVFPGGGQQGETLAAKFIGDPAGDFLQTFKLPAMNGARFGLQPEHDGIAPSPNWIRVTTVPNGTTVPTATTQAKAPLLDEAPPVAFNGILETKGEPAFFRVKAKKDQNLEFQVYARRLGSPIDTVLTVLDARGRSLGSNDDASGLQDSMVRVKIPADGEYSVKVADQLGRGGPLYAWRVEITEVKPALTLSIPDTARYDNETRKSIVVPRGNRFAVLVNINRDSFNGDVALTFPGLPAGMRSLVETVPGSLSAVPVVFEAEAEAPIAGKLLTPAAKSVTDGAAPEVASRYRHNVDWVRIQNDTVYVRSEVDQIAAAVVEAVPFKVRIVEPKAPLVQSGEMNLQIVAERDEGFDEPITVKMLWNPPGVSSLPDMVIPKGASTVSYKLNTNAKAEVRKWKIAVVAGATVKGGMAYVSSQLAPLEIAPAFLLGKMNLAKVERGQSAKVTCTLEHKLPFEGTAVARLVGLPGNVKAAEVEITKDSKEVVFEVVTTDKSPTGMTKNVFCSVVIQQDGEPVTQTIAQGSMLRIDAPRGAPAIAALEGGRK
ncbi:MAG TPA: PPC domain-containing protein [Opitutaceae bacterium]|nr:PPC domain-containing protein [Opitutaceae bacterium]